MTPNQKNDDKNQAEKNSLIDAIVKKAEETSREKITTKIDDRDPYAGAMLAKIALSSSLIFAFLSLLISASALSKSNLINSKFDKENLSTTLDSKKSILRQVGNDIDDVKNFNSLIQLENLSRNIVELETDSESIEKLKSETISLQKELFKKRVQSIKKNAEDLRILNTENDVIKKSSKEMLKLIKNIDIDNLIDSGVTSADYTYITSAKISAKEIMVEIKEMNLRNMINNLKKQAKIISTINDSSEKNQSITSFTEGVEKISIRRINSLESAVSLHDEIILPADNQDLLSKIEILGEDLKDAAKISKNLGRLTISNDIEKQRIKWSEVIENVKTVTRLGADLKSDLDQNYVDPVARDLDPEETLITFTGFSTDSEDRTIEIKGQANGVKKYKDQSITLLANLIDAFESSNLFQGVEGYNFSKNISNDGSIYTPISIKLNLQEIGSIHPNDLKTSSSTSSSTSQAIEIPDFDPNEFKSVSSKPAPVEENQEIEEATSEEIISDEENNKIQETTAQESVEANEEVELATEETATDSLPQEENKDKMIPEVFAEINKIF